MSDLWIGLVIFAVLTLAWLAWPDVVRWWRSRSSGRQAYQPGGDFRPAQVPATLPAGPDVLSPREFWRKVFDQVVHLSIFGPTGSGKTRFASTLYQQVLRDPESQVLVITSKSRNIWGLRPIGIPEEPGEPVRYEEIVSALRALTREMRRRQSLLFHDHNFDYNVFKVWVFIDEELDLATNPITAAEYATFTQVFSSLARELRMHFVKMNQDKTVGATGTAGMGGLRENLTSIAIDRDTHVVTMSLGQKEYRLEDTKWLTAWKGLAPDSVPEEKIFELDLTPSAPTEVTEIEILNECPAGHPLTEGQMKAYRCPECEKEGRAFSPGKSPGRFNQQMVREAQLRRGLLKEEKEDVRVYSEV